MKRLFAVLTLLLVPVTAESSERSTLISCVESAIRSGLRNESTVLLKTCLHESALFHEACGKVAARDACTLAAIRIFHEACDKLIAEETRPPNAIDSG